MSDQLPTCPKCGDLSSVGATHCETCDAPLTELVAYLDRAAHVRRDNGRFASPTRPHEGATP